MRKLKHEEDCSTEALCKYCKARARTAKWLAAHPGEKERYGKEYRERNAVKIREQQRVHAEKNKESRKIYFKEWYQNNRDQWIKNVSTHSKTPEAKAVRNKRFKERYKNDFDFRLARKIRTRFRVALRRANAKKMGIFETELMGCTILELKKHLEALFKPDMSWDNYGLKGWHIDHIKPLALFDLSDLEQQKQACHYTNLQPLWADENIKKWQIDKKP